MGNPNFEAWTPNSPSSRTPWAPDVAYPDVSPEVGQDWAFSPEGGNVTEDTRPLVPGSSSLGLPRVPIQPPAQVTLSNHPRECLFPPPSCPVPWVRPRQRWYFDPATRTCSQFQYSCGEGLNNFHTRSLCSSYCQETRQPKIPKYPSYAAPVEIPKLTAVTLPQYIDSNKNTLVEFYTEWCNACRVFWPKFQAIASHLR